MFKKSQPVRKSRLELGLDHQSAALDVFNQVRENLDNSDALLEDHVEQNKAMMAQMQQEVEEAEAARAKNRQVRDVLGGIV